MGLFKKPSESSQGPYPGGIRERLPSQALHGISAGGREASLRRVPDHYSVGAQRSPLLGGNGDSGGPIVCNGIAEGIVTTGSTVCGNWRKPGIYTRTAPYVSWINSIIESNV
ncbi:hypothetical protein E2320_022082 [Naja naja]|nr:hypothetical protein E2320_022082 [Naja naja]